MGEIMNTYCAGVLHLIVSELRVSALIFVGSQLYANTLCHLFVENA